MKNRLLLLALGALCLPVAAQTPVPRPAVPSATTLASPTSQIAAWYRYAVYLESKLAAAPAPAPSLQSIADKLDALAARPAVAVGISNSKVTLTATATGTAPFVFTWFKDGAQVFVGNPYVVASGSAASYYVVASNSAGNATSSTLVVTAP